MIQQNLKCFGTMQRKGLVWFYLRHGCVFSLKTICRKIHSLNIVRNKKIRQRFDQILQHIKYITIIFYHLHCN